MRPHGRSKGSSCRARYHIRIDTAYTNGDFKNQPAKRASSSATACLPYPTFVRSGSDTHLRSKALNLLCLGHYSASDTAEMNSVSWTCREHTEGCQSGPLPLKLAEQCPERCEYQYATRVLKIAGCIWLGLMNRAGRPPALSTPGGETTSTSTDP